MGDQSSSSSNGMRFLSFANDQEDAEKTAKLKEAALRIEKAIERQKSVSELIDYKPPPEEEIDLANDTRPLYQRLLEQKNKKQEAFDESQKLSNLVTKLDEDEANYLNELAKSKQEEEIRKRLEIYDVLEEKKRNSERKIIEEENKLKQSFLGLKTQRNVASATDSLKSKLSSLIKIKPKPQANKSATDTMVQKNRGSIKDTTAASYTAKRQSTEMNHPTLDECKSDQPTGQCQHSDLKRLRKSTDTEGQQHNRDDEPAVHVDHSQCNGAQNDVMRCIGVLPSLPLVGDSHDSSDSDNSDDVNPRIVPRLRGNNK